MAELVAKIDYKELVIDSGARQISQGNSPIRPRSATVPSRSRFRPYGYPTITFTTEADPALEALEAQTFISKYASIVVMKTVKIEYLMSLLTWRTNLYTDPQKPKRCSQASIIRRGDPRFTGLYHYKLLPDLLHGAAEVEGTRVPSYLIAFDTDGLSVMTAWAGGKFIGEAIGPWLKDSRHQPKVNHKKIIIPGGVAAIKGKIEDLSGWEVMVGAA